MSVVALPDPKPARRLRSFAGNFSLAVWTEERNCVVCGEPAANADHILLRSQGGDDVVENGLSLCGTGTMGCHGRKHAADPETLRRIGEAIVARPAKLAYVLDKLGEDAGREHMRRVFLTEVP